MSSRLLKTVAEVTRTVSAGSAFQQSMRRQAKEKDLALLLFIVLASFNLCPLLIPHLSVQQPTNPAL